MRNLFLLCILPCASAVTLKVLNEAMLPIDLYWIGLSNTPIGSPMRQNKDPIDVRHGIDVDSYAGHLFRVHFSGNGTGAGVSFVKGTDAETVVVSYNTNTQSFSLKQLTEEEAKMAGALQLCGPQHKDGFAECVADQIYQEFDKLETTYNELKYSRAQMSNKLRDYTCSDRSLATTAPLRTEHMTAGETEVTVNTFLDTSHAKIFAVDNFVLEEECDILMNHGRPRLKRATVAAVDGTSVVSESRKAQQASYDKHISSTTDPLWPLYSRILNVTNTLNGYNLTAEGQEGFTIIQYKPGDEYVNHCDADCGGEPVTVGGRIATAVLYCQVPEVGGATSFSNADVFVNPVKGTATFFSYMNPQTEEMDNGLTEHSGCPVIEGEKMIAVTWMRYGVTTERPNSILDPSGNSILFQ